MIFEQPTAKLQLTTMPETATEPKAKAAPKRVTKPRVAKAVKKVEVPAADHKLRIRVRAYEHGILDSSVKQIIDTAARYNAEVVGPVPLPIDIKKYTVNRAAFIDKDSREQF